MTNAPPAPPRVRSAADYDGESSLRAALTEPPYAHHPAPAETSVGSCVFDGNLSSICCDWQNPTLDLSTSVGPQSVEDEVKRLMELKRYSILDSEHEAKFERMTALASRIFDVPICLVSLVDIGRQWFMSNRGLGEVRETSRHLSFCAHAILSKEDVFVIPDTYEDPRFKENGLVTGAPFIRFYAGVPLVTPGGYKLGTFCIIDREPRPGGLSLNEKQNLREITEMVVDTLAHRMQEMERLMDEKTRLIACAAHDLLSPLTGIQLNLGLLMEDESLSKKLDNNQKELMEASVKCADVIERICVQAIRSFRGDFLMRTGGAAPSQDVTGSGLEKGLVNVDQLVDNINRVVGAFPKKVPFFIEKDENVPQAIISDDLKIFRSIMNYLTNACKQTPAGSIRLHIYVRRAVDSAEDMELGLLPGALVAPKRDILVMEVHDTGPGIDVEKYPSLFTPLCNEGVDGNGDEGQTPKSGLGLYSVATEISSLGGEFGVFPRQDLVSSPDLDQSLDTHHSDHDPRITGCVFWLSVPLILPGGASPVDHVSPKDIDSGDERCELPRKEKRAVGAVAPCNGAPAESRTSTTAQSKRSSSDAGRESLPRRTKKAALSGSLTKPADDPSAKVVGMLSDVAIEMQRTKRALIIDDSLTIRKGLSRGFSRLGFEVDEAENGLLGFKKLKSSAYDIVLLDFLMPVMDGPEVATRFRSWERDHRPDFRQYIVGISAHANGKDAELGIKAGMDRFMAKPVPLKAVKDLAQCKPVTDASALLNKKFRLDMESIEAAKIQAEVASDEVNSKSSRSSSASTFARHSALIAMQDEATVRPLRRIIEKAGWRAVVVGSGDDALRLLKLRNWDAAFIDGDLRKLSGTNCLVRFRDWEKQSRSVEQRNVFVVSDVFTASSLPRGFNGVLGKQLNPREALLCLKIALKVAPKVSFVAVH